MKRVTGTVIDLTDEDIDPPKRTRTLHNDPITVAINDSNYNYNSNNNNNYNAHIDQNNIQYNNFNQLYDIPQFNNTLENNTIHNNFENNNLQNFQNNFLNNFQSNFQNNDLQNNNLQNNNLQHNLQNDLQNGFQNNFQNNLQHNIPHNTNNIQNIVNIESDENIHVRDKEKEAQANKDYFNSLLPYFTPTTPADTRISSPFTPSTNLSAPGVYTPPNLRTSKPFVPLPVPPSSFSSSLPSFPLSNFPMPPLNDTSALPPIIELDSTSLFSQKYPPVPPSSSSSLPNINFSPPSLFTPTTNNNIHFNINSNNNSNNNNNNTNNNNFSSIQSSNINSSSFNSITFVNGGKKKKEKDPLSFHVYDPRKTTDTDNRNALQRINNYINNPPPAQTNNNNSNISSNNNNNRSVEPVMIDLSNINDDDEDELYYGNVRIKLEGACSGAVSKEENVSITREPEPNDPNRFAVHNVLNAKVGVLDRFAACILAPLVDSSKLRIEGVIPVKGDLVVQCYGKSSDRDDVVAKLKSLDLAIGARLDKIELEKLQQNRVKVDKFNMQPDEMLDIPLSGDDLPLAEPPNGLVSPLYPHQRQALHWMLDRERNRPSTLFWKKRGNSYMNSVTNSVVTTPPADCHGGILGDEMGLGKTLEVISLVLASKNADTANGTKSGPSIVVCPLSTLSNWSDQITRHCGRNVLTMYMYHGTSRTADIALLSSFDIIITTYNIVGLEFASNARVASPLYSILWKRVVLDEAHLIKNRSTQQTQAAWGLRATCKWCLTGTPIQNKIDDMYSLLRFIRLEPFTDFTWWTRLITRPIKNKDISGYSRLKAILQHVILRRTKDKHIDLPTKTIYMQTLDFSVEERAYYDSLYRFGKSQFDQYARSGSVLQHYAHVLELLLRLRQTCDHPDLVPATSFANQSAPNPDLLKTGELDECCICMDKAIEPVATKCLHIFCKTCIFQAISMSSNSCPLCRAPILPREIYPVKFNEAEEPKLSITNQKSTKVDALLLDLRSVRERDPTIKSIVFSQFTTFLDIIQTSLTAHAIRTVRLDGKMSHEQRAESMRVFAADPSITVFLLSLKAGGVGLNLVAASRVYMMDPWWNPAVEDQAIDRVHRLGQTRPVEVIRFVIRGTVEEKIMKLQQRKMDMAASALEAKSKQQLQEMRLDDLNLLFS